jgi:hypothetical protein
MPKYNPRKNRNYDLETYLFLTFLLEGNHRIKVLKIISKLYVLLNKTKIMPVRTEILA